MKEIVKLVLMNLIVFVIALVFLCIAIPIYTKQPMNKIIVQDAILISYAFCAVFTFSFFFLSTRLVQDLFEAIEN
jgi:energy-coupling factor transporter transmembrane protein EcfT